MPELQTWICLETDATDKKYHDLERMIERDAERKRFRLNSFGCVSIIEYVYMLLLLSARLGSVLI